MENKIKVFLEEDIPNEDITSMGTVDKNTQIIAEIHAVEEMIFSGTQIIKSIFKFISNVDILVSDGDSLKPGDSICRIQGNAIQILSRERVLLNLIQRMSGIATNVRKYVKLAKKNDVLILDTRKTTPGLRRFEKYAVTCGGGLNHRYSLSDGILIKDNHIKAAGGVKSAIEKVKSKNFNLPIEIEVDYLNQISEALDSGAEGILLDNMSPEKTVKAVKLIRSTINGKNIFIESSGGMNYQNFHHYLNTGINAISIGGLTHSVSSSDIRMEFKSI